MGYINTIAPSNISKAPLVVGGAKCKRTNSNSSSYNTFPPENQEIQLQTHKIILLHNRKYIYFIVKCFENSDLNKTFKKIINSLHIALEYWGSFQDQKLSSRQRLYIVKYYKFDCACIN
jgi:hypothetical protein